MQSAAKRPKPPEPSVSGVARLPSAPEVVRIGRPANDNMPLWTLRAGRAIVIGGVALASLVIAALVYA